MSQEQEPKTLHKILETCTVEDAETEILSWAMDYGEQVWEACASYATELVGDSKPAHEVYRDCMAKKPPEPK